MSDDIRDQVAAEMLSLLNADLPDGIPEWSLEHMFDFEVDELPAATMYLLREKISKPGPHQGPAVNPPIRVRALEVQFEIRTKAVEGGGTTARQSTSPLTDHLTARLGGVQSPGRLFYQIDEDSIDWIYEGADLTYCTAIVICTVWYQTRTTNAGLRA